jgi:pSer/pThr/pTyr-binding forkhead associated (FHA) protein
VATSPVHPGICSACGYVNLPGETFCQNCGVQLAPVASVPPPPPSLASAAAFPVEGIQAAAQEQLQPSSSFGRLILIATRVEIRLPSQKIEVVIGRADPAKAVYPDLDLTPFGGEAQGVSRLHARLIRRDGRTFIEDLNSTNFTFINKHQLQPGKLYPLQNGDEISLAKLSFEYLSGEV